MALTQHQTAPAKFESPGCINSSAKTVQSQTEPSKSSSSIPAFKHLISRLAKDTLAFWRITMKSRRTVLKSLPFLGPAFLMQRPQASSGFACVNQELVGGALKEPAVVKLGPRFSSTEVNTGNPQ